MKISELSEKAKVKCKLCNKLLSIDNFYVSKNEQIDYRCKTCYSLYKKESYILAKSAKNKTVAKTKVCTTCKEKKYKKEFPKYPISKDGYSHVCYKCKQMKQSLNDNPDKYWWKRSSILARYKKPHASAAELKQLYQDQNKLCKYCEIAIDQTNLSMDHKIPISMNGAHTIDNIVLCCRDCNLLKLDKTYDEFILFLKSYSTRILNMSTRTEGSEEIAESGAERSGKETISHQESETS